MENLMADRAFSSTVGANGIATITIKTGGYQTWRVTQVSVEMANAPIGTGCFLRKNGSLITPLVATGDAASGEPPIDLLPSDTMTVQWSGATPGLSGSALVIYEVIP